MPRVEKKETRKTREKPKTPFLDDGGFLSKRTEQSGFRFIKNRERLLDSLLDCFRPGTKRCGT
jgi:hypothetical protein